MDGKIPFIDPRYRARSPAESKLVDVLERCYVYDAEERASMFELAASLRETFDELQKLEPKDDEDKPP